MRDPSFDLAAALARPGFTPAVRDADALVALLERDDDAVGKRATRGLVMLGAAGRAAILRRLGLATTAAATTAEGIRVGPRAAGLNAGGSPSAEGAGRPLEIDEGLATRLIAALGGLVREGDEEATRALLPLVGAASERWRRAAVVALGKLGGDAARGALVLPEALVREARAAILGRWDAEGVSAAERRALTEALGKLGGGEAVEKLTQLKTAGDAELERRRERALLMSQRDLRRAQEAAEASLTDSDPDPDPDPDSDPDPDPDPDPDSDPDPDPGSASNSGSASDPGSASGSDAEPHLRSSPGVRANALLSSIDADALLPSVSLTWHCRGGIGPLLGDELTALGHRVSEVRSEHVVTRFAGRFGAVHASRLWTQLGVIVPLASGELPAAVPAALTQPWVRKLLASATRGAIRWRLEMASGGPRRGMVWQIVRDVAAAAPELVNEPADTTWTVVVDERRRQLELRPRRLADPRFAWRQLDLPSASHPTVAAAVARLAKPRAGERVWDPFTGSGSELIECAIAAASNDQRAAPLVLFGSDLDPVALQAATANTAAAGVSASLTHADARSHQPGPIDLIASNPPLGGRLRGDAGQLLCDAVPGFARALVRGGRMVWITPSPRRTSPAAEDAGLLLDRAFDVDLGGLRARLERWHKPK